MKKQFGTLMAILATFVLFAGVAAPSLVFAQGESNSTTVTQDTPTDDSEDGTKDRTDMMVHVRKGGRALEAKKHMAKLTERKLAMCQKRERVVKQIMNRIVTRGERHLEVFNKISERVQAFYTDKGKTLDNYNELVSDVGAKKTNAEAALDAIKADAEAFKCDDNNPKGVGSAFKTDLKAAHQALKEYRTSIKDLLVGVKSVQSTDAKTEEGSN